MNDKTSKAIEAIKDAIVWGKDKVAVIEEIREELHRLSPLKDQPVDRVRWVRAELVEPNDYNPNAVARKEMGLLYVSIRQDGYCVGVETPILCDDLVWRPAGTLKVGDKIIAFDEEPVPGAQYKHARRFCTAEVTHNHRQRDRLYRVITDRGEVLTNAAHPWLGQRMCGDASKRTLRWMQTEDLRAGDLLMHLVDPWEQETTYDAGWLAGFLDGEGSLAQSQAKTHAPGHRLAAYQRPGPTADRMAREITARVCATVRTHEHENEKWNDMVMVRVGRIGEVMRLLGLVRPERLITAGYGFWEGVSIAREDCRATVIEVQDAGLGDIASLATSSRMYIASGFAMHNTQPIVTIWDEEKGKYVIIDGFHRFYVGKTKEDIQQLLQGYLPIVVIDKPINDRMASTVRHNRARGEHSVGGMGKLVFEMLDNGWDDAEICNQMGLEPEELLKLKHITGFSALFKNVEYSKAWETKKMIRMRLKAQKGATNEA